jgi:hypothetical protein
MMWKDRSWPNLGCYPGICLAGLKKTTKSLSQLSRSPGRDLDPGTSEYEAQVVSTQTRRTVTMIKE